MRARACVCKREKKDGRRLVSSDAHFMHMWCTNNNNNNNNDNDNNIDKNVPFSVMIKWVRDARNRVNAAEPAVSSPAASPSAPLVVLLLLLLLLLLLPPPPPPLLEPIPPAPALPLLLALAAFAAVTAAEDEDEDEISALTWAVGITSRS